MPRLYPFLHAQIKIHVDNYKGIINTHEVAQDCGHFAINARNDTIRGRISETYDMAKYRYTLYPSFQWVSKLYIQYRYFWQCLI